MESSPRCRLFGHFGLIAQGDGNVSGLSLAGIWNQAGESLVGVQLAGLVARSGGTTAGIQLGGLISFTAESLDGIQLGGFGNQVGDSLVGVQLGGLLNRVEGHASGFQLAGVGNIVGECFHGIQLAGLINRSNGEGCMDGIQLATINLAGEVEGVQLGLVNKATGVNGLQVGLVNITEAMSGFRPLGELHCQWRLSVYGADEFRSDDELRGILMMRLVWLGVESSYSHSSLALPLLSNACRDVSTEWSWYLNDQDTHSSSRRVVSLEPDVVSSTAYIFNRMLFLMFLVDRVVSRCCLPYPECLGGWTRCCRAVRLRLRGCGEGSVLPLFLERLSSGEGCCIPAFVPWRENSAVV